MIVASCDRCGAEIPSDEKAGCRLVVGSREWSWHLCQEHREELELMLPEWLEAHEWRVVKS